jgi:ABC-type polysaccharide/polyol phosphate export permease
MTATTATTATTAVPATIATPHGSGRRLGALLTLARRRMELTARTPRELVVPLVTPVLFALVIAPALARTVGAFFPGVDYMTYVSIATVGLLVPLTMMFSGVSVIADRESGARRDLLAAPIPRPLIVVGNLVVALLISAMQIAVLLVASLLRGADYRWSATGAAWFLATVALLGIGMYGVAEALANRTPKIEGYIAVVPAIAIVPWFFAGSLFRVATLPTALGWFARFLPLTHAMALMRYGLQGGNALGLRDIWGMSNPTTMAALSLTVLATFAVLMTAVSVRVFTRAAVR